MSRLQKSLDQGERFREFEDKLMLVPLSSVEYMKVAPKPDFQLPNAVHMVDELD